MRSPCTPGSLLTCAAIALATCPVAAQPLDDAFGRTAAVIEQYSASQTGTSWAVSGDSVYVGYHDSGTIRFRASRDRGATFGPVVEFDFGTVCSNQAPRVAAHGDRVWVLYPTECTNPDLLLLRSSDRGATFDGPVVLRADAPRSFVQYAVYALASGNVLALWRVSTGNLRVEFSDDDGESFTTTYFGPDTALNRGIAVSWSEDASRVALAFATGNQLVAYLSDDGGASWGGAFRVDDDSVVSNPNAPRLQFAGDRIAFAWIEDGDVYFRRRNPNGALTVLRNLSEGTAGAFTNRLSMVADGDELHVAWADRSAVFDPSGRDEVVHRQSLDAGQSFTAARNVSATPNVYSQSPALGLTDEFVVLHWDERPAGLTQDSRRSFRILSRTVSGTDFVPPPGQAPAWVDDDERAAARLFLSPDGAIYIRRALSYHWWLARWEIKDCDGNGAPDVLDIAGDESLDCNTNGTLDAFDLVPDDGSPCSGQSADDDGDGAPDECLVDCDGDVMTFEDGDGDGLPDECQSPETECNPFAFVDRSLTNTAANSMTPRSVVSGDRVHVTWFEGAVVHAVTLAPDETGWLVAGDAVPLDTTGVFNGSTEVAIAAQGDDVHIAWRVGSTAVAFTRSTDGGETYEAPRVLRSYSRLTPARLRAVATPGGKVFVSWTLQDIEGYFVIASSRDRGETFGLQTLTSNRAPGYGVASGGERLFAFLKDFSDEGLRLVSVEDDGGGSFRVDQLLMRQTPNGVPETRDTRIAASRSGVWVAWREGHLPGDIFIRRSLDGGRTFSPAIQLDDPGNDLDGNGGLGLGAVGDEVVVAWPNKTLDPFGRTEIVVRKSYNGGQAFGPVQNISQTVNSHSTQPWLVASGDRLVVGWTEGTASRFRFSSVFGNAYSPGLTAPAVPAPGGSVILTDSAVHWIRSQNSDLWLSSSVLYDCNTNGIPDPCELDTDADGVIDDCDDDVDGDGIANADDNCPGVANPGQANEDGDSLGDACDACPGDAVNDADGDEICGVDDNCPEVANPDQIDTDADGLGDACDLACPNDPLNDPDGDGVCNSADNCPEVANPDQIDTDADGFGDACDILCPEDPLNDADGDGTCEASDNCPGLANPSQADADGDGLGNECDTLCPDDPLNDPDGDDVCNSADNCPEAANPDQTDTDGDGFGDVCDPDCDNDAVLNDDDNCACVSNPGQIDLDEDGQGNVCDDDLDGDGVLNRVDNCPSVPNPEQRDTDGDGRGDACEDGVGDFMRGDSNADGVLDLSDSVYTLSFLFLGGSRPRCLAAANSNGDGDVDLSDAIFALSFLFIGGPPLTPPFPGCGSSDLPQDVELGCRSPICP